MNNTPSNRLSLEQLVVSEKRIQYVKSGSAGQSIVFLSGHRTPVSNWKKVIPSVTAHGTVLAYDRLDTGGSDQSSVPQDGDEILSTLDGLVEAVELDPPYILVAHSLGGLYANLYARRNPDKVSAVIMVEASHPSEASEHQISQEKPGSLISKLFMPDFKKNPNSEYNYVQETVAQIERAPKFPDVYLAVITGRNKMPFVPKAAFGSHLKWQEQLVSLSTRGYQVIAEKSAHVPQVSEPDLIVKTIADAAQSLR